MDEQDFIIAILNEPHSSAPALVFADWLEERGDERADTIRETVAEMKPKIPSLIDLELTEMYPKVIKAFFSFDDEKCQLIADLCNGGIYLDYYDIDERFPKTRKLCEQFYNPPSGSELIMLALDEVLEGFGIEAIRDPDDSDHIIGEYSNQGDTYDGTIVLDDDGNFHLTTFGDFYEGWIADQNEENDTIQCGNCSHLTPMNEENWHDVICEQCDNRVGG